MLRAIRHSRNYQGCFCAMISNIVMPWVCAAGCDVIKEISENIVFNRPGRHWVECKRCGNRVYVDEMPLDKSKCPECGYDGDVRHKWSKRK